jgi:sulfur relay (sulfurtransferase) complex TusBCD TusD component (DsrE family)
LDTKTKQIQIKVFFYSKAGHTAHQIQKASFDEPTVKSNISK